MDLVLIQYYEYEVNSRLYSQLDKLNKTKVIYLGQVCSIDNKENTIVKSKNNTI